MKNIKIIKLEAIKNEVMRLSVYSNNKDSFKDLILEYIKAYRKQGYKIVD